MITRYLFGSPAHQHQDPARRITGIAELPVDAPELAALLTADPVAEVRAAAARRSTRLDALIAAWSTESAPDVRSALTEALGPLLAASEDATAVQAFLSAPACADAIRADVARRTQDAERRRAALSAIGDEGTLVELALHAEHAETRLGATEFIGSQEGLRKVSDAARQRDQGVARLARKRMEAIAAREGGVAAADAILAELEALATRPGPILTAVIELNRRWQALDLGDDAERLARCDAARRTLQARFDREHEEQRARARLEQRLAEWLGRTETPETAEDLAARRDELDALRAAATDVVADSAFAGRLEEAAQRLVRWDEAFAGRAAAEALVQEAEQLATGTSIDNAKLPERWQALDRGIRTPALTRRFEAALITIEQRRLAQIDAAKQEAQAVRHQVHTLLHSAEQALAAGQLDAARKSLDDIRPLRRDAGLLPKPTLQRLGRLTQQLTELERWESFGQRQARLQLCERAEAAAGIAEAMQAAREVQQLRNEWKTLDQQHAGVPKSLWERFDRACEKAYAPAAKLHAQQAAQRKEARGHREAFIAEAEAHGPSLLGEPRDWRAIERWLRECDHKWREGDLGSVDPKTWKALDTRYRTALAPVREALAAARDAAKAARNALIEEVRALQAKATERDAPAQVKAIQSRWQANAKELSLPQRDERALWEQFRSACDAVFTTREAVRKQEDGVKHEGRRALEEVCAQLEALAKAKDTEEAALRKTLRDLQDQWKQKNRGGPPAPRNLFTRYTNAVSAVETALAARLRSRKAAVWQVLAAKEKLCDDLDRRVVARASSGDAAAEEERWNAWPALPAAWEKAMQARRDDALRALGDAAAQAERISRIERGADARRETLLELEMLLGLDSPPELRQQRLALQVKHLRDRFKSDAAGSAGSPADRLFDWCTRPGAIEPGDRARADRVFAAIERAR